MSRIIVNEGSGPRPVDLSVPRLIVGGSADCEVRLRHASAGGCGFVLEATPTGHRVLRLRGELFLNEEPCEVADLLHNDTLRAGEVMVLYKNPAASRPEPSPTPDPARPEVPAAADEAPPEDEPELLAIEELDAPLEDAVPHEPPPVLEEGETGAEPLAETELPVEACEAERAARVFAPPVAAGPPPEASPRAPTAGAPEPEDAEFVLLEDEPVPSASAAPPPPRPAPTGPVRFARPLPPGCRAPGGPPPAHPGRPPR